MIVGGLTIADTPVPPPVVAGRPKCSICGVLEQLVDEVGPEKILADRLPRVLSESAVVLAYAQGAYDAMHFAAREALCTEHLELLSAPGQCPAKGKKR